MTRFHLLQDILKNHRYFKVVCGAGNEDPLEVERLALVYTLAGAMGIDVSANVEVVRAAVQGIDTAMSLAPELGRHILQRPFITVSVGLKGDPHVRKAGIQEDRCTQCGECLPVCEQGAITEGLQVLAPRCIGCGACAEICPVGAVEFHHTKVDFHEILPQCLEAGAENLELHAVTPDDEAVRRDWSILAALVPHNFISMCLDRSRLSDEHLIARIKEAKEIAGERMIVQADGIPMSGGQNDFNTTLQAIAIADIVQKHHLPVMLLASGGTNSKTGGLARLCNVRLNGISVGTFARKLIRPEIADPHLASDMQVLRRAVRQAADLVEANLRPLSE